MKAKEEIQPANKNHKKNKQSGANAALLLSTIVAPGAIEFKNHPEQIE
jgi:hypothetical protein